MSKTINFDKIDNFFESLVVAYRKTLREDSNFFQAAGSDARLIFRYLLNIKFQDESVDYVIVPAETLAKKMMVNIKTVRSRYKHMASYGLIECKTEYDKKTAKRFTKIYINPVLLEESVLLGRVQTRYRNKVCKNLVELGLYRNCVMEYDGFVQGFKGNHTVWGSNEFIEPIGSLYNDIHAGTAADKRLAEKRKENQKWRNYGKMFIADCAKIWLTYQKNRGNSSATPDWALDNLSPGMRRERTELIKVFENYGAQVAFFAWVFFCGNEIEYGKDGRAVYDPTKPYQQFRMVDMKPSQFVKYLSSILTAPAFRLMTTTHWGTGNDLDAKLILDKALNIGLREVGPRDGSDYADLLGFRFGELEVPIVTN